MTTYNFSSGDNIPTFVLAAKETGYLVVAPKYVSREFRKKVAFHCELMAAIRILEKDIALLLQAKRFSTDSVCICKLKITATKYCILNKNSLDYKIGNQNRQPMKSVGNQNDSR